MLPRTAGLATISVGTVFDIATAGGIVSLALATVLRKADRQTWAANGVVCGLGIGAITYVILLLAQL